MEVVIGSDGNLLALTESDFEVSFIKTLQDKLFLAHVKTGASQADVVGLKFIPTAPDKRAEELLFAINNWYHNTGGEMPTGVANQLDDWVAGQLRLKD